RNRSAATRRKPASFVDTTLSSVPFFAIGALPKLGLDPLEDTRGQVFEFLFHFLFMLLTQNIGPASVETVQPPRDVQLLALQLLHHQAYVLRLLKVDAEPVIGVALR